MEDWGIQVDGQTSVFPYAGQVRAGPLSLTDQLPGDQRPIDAWSERVMANVRLMAADENYRRHVGLLAMGDPSAWRRHRETISEADSKPQSVLG